MLRLFMALSNANAKVLEQELPCRDIFVNSYCGMIVESQNFSKDSS